MNNESPSTSQTRTRIVLLVLLTALALGTVGADIVGVFRGEPTSLDLGMVTDVRGHQLEVVRLIAADRNRRVTSAYRAGLRMGDRIMAARVNDDQWLVLDRMTSWWKVLRHLNSSGEVEFKIDPVATEEFDEVLIRLVITPEDPLSPMRWIVLGLCVVALLTAAFIGFGRPDNAQAFTASLLFFSCSSMFSQQNALLVPGLWEVSLAYHALLNACATYLFMSFFLGFPSPSVLAIRFPWLRIAGRVAVGLHLMFAGAVLVTVSSSFRAYESLVVGLTSAVPFVISAMHVVMMLIGFASLILNTIRAQGVDERRRMVILLTGSVVGLVPLLAVGVLAYSIGLAEVPLWAIGVAISASVCFPVSFIYVVVRHRVLGIRVILRRGLQYALVSRGFLVVEALVLVALFIVTARSAFGRVIPEEGTIGLMIAAAVGLALFLGLRSVNRRIMPIIDRRFFREAYDTERVLAGLSTQVRCCAGRPRELLEVLAGTVGDALSVDIVAIYLAAPVNPIWCGAATSRGQTGGFGSCIVHTHPQAQIDSPNTSRLDLPPNAPFSSVLTRVDPERPEIVELYAGHPELLRRSGGERERVAEVQRHQHQVVEQLNLRLVVPLTTSDQVIGFIALGEKLSEEAYSGRDKDLLLGVAGQAAVAIDYAQMIVDVAESERLQHEIHLAGGVLGSLLPSEPPTIEGFDVKHVILPAQEVAGDFLQYFPAPDGGVSLVVGDVAGKGLRAAMVVTMALGGLEAIVQETRDPGAVLSRLNDLLMHRLGREGFVTCIFAHLDPRNGRLALANAGHPYPMLRDSKTSVWYELTGEGPRFPLGVRRGVGYQTVETTLAESADMVIMSDGVIEAPDSDGNQLGFDGVAQLLSEFSGGQGEVIQYLLDGVHEHMGDGRQQDDISLISLSRSSE